MSYDPAPLSKTAKYKKITKPLLERKRRARINRCLDELKDLMVGALEIDDDNLSKLEKADILELTVNHLTKLHSPKDSVLEAKKFQAGFGQCAAEACRFIMSVPDLDAKVSQNLISHLSRLITVQPLMIQVPERPPFSPPVSPASVVSDRHHYYSDQDRSSSDAEDSAYSGEIVQKQCTQRVNSRAPKNITTTGLLTTVDKVSPNYLVPEQLSSVPNQRNGAYINKFPAEAKDVILQKIRQHIMDKRVNENYNPESNGNVEICEPKYSHTDDAYSYNYLPQITNDTLDLRKVRSPSKCVITNSPNKPVVFHATNQLNLTPPSENKAETPSSLPEQCELPMDYSNLPPKKKRKLIEYQEYKKQEEARRQLDAFCAEKKEQSNGRPPAESEEDGNKWRPW